MCIRDRIEETIDETVSTVFSNYYKISNDKKEYIGQTQTIISNITNDVSVVKILENGNVIDSQLINFSGSNTYYNPNHDDIVDTVMPMASVEYKWHYPVSYTHLDVYKRQGKCRV